MGSPLGVVLRVCIRTRSDRRLSWILVFLFLRDEVTLGGRVCVSLYVLDRNECCHLACSGFHVPSRWGHPLGSSIRIHTFSIGSKELLVAGCCALALLGVWCWQLAVFFWPHLLLCFEFQFCWLLVLGLSTLRLFAYRDVNLYTVFNPPVCSGSAEFLTVLYYYMVQSLHDGVTLAGWVCGQAYALDRNEDCLNLSPRSFGMRSPFWSSVVFGPH